jgi:hypothetical protein
VKEKRFFIYRLFRYIKLPHFEKFSWMIHRKGMKIKSDGKERGWAFPEYRILKRLVRYREPLARGCFPDKLGKKHFKNI